MIQFEGEIAARPARTWFQTEKQKKRVKEMSRGDHVYGDSDDIAAKNKKNDDRQEDLDEKNKKKKKKKDPLQGLSRAKKRRKLQRMEEERAREEYEREIEEMGGTKKKTPQQRMIGAAKKAKSERRPTRDKLDSQDDVATKTMKRMQHLDQNNNHNQNNDDAQAKAKVRRKYREQPLGDEELAHSFGRRYAKSNEKGGDDSKSGKNKPFRVKSRKAFKSKGRYKRRK
jgi:ATP-dependent RNA helicase DDX27